MRVLTRDGLEALTIARLAAELDMAVGAMYRYFSGKDALLVALQRRAIVAFRDELERRTEGAGPLEAVVAAARAYLGFRDVDAAAAELIEQVLAAPFHVLPDEEALRVIDVTRPALERLVEVFEAAAEAGALDPGPPLQRTLALWASLHGVTQFAKLARLGLRPDDLGDEIITALVLGWGADRAEVMALLDTEETQ